MAYVVRTLRDSFSPLRLPNLRIYLIGQAVSLLGTWMQVTAQGWLVWELSKSEAALGITAMLGSLIAAMVLAFVLAVLVATGTVQLWHVYVLSFLLGCVAAFDFPAQQAFI